MATQIKSRNDLAAVLSTPVPSTPILKFRALTFLMLVELGFTHSQASTSVDVYLKGTETIRVVWGTTQMVGFSHMVGKAIKAEAQGTTQGKLQRLQASTKGQPSNAKGANDFTWKWSKLTPKKVEALELLASQTFKVIPA